jgi:hypothetical protein
MFSSYTGRRHKNKFVRNKCFRFLLMSFLKIFNCRKRNVAMQKKSLKKGKKKREKNIVHVLEQKCFPSFKQERHVLRSIVELG